MTHPVGIYALDGALSPDADTASITFLSDEAFDAFQSLMPPGAAWPTDEGTTLVELEHALSYEFARVKRRAKQLEKEIYPDTCYELLSDYERVWGLPDACFQPTTITERRLALKAKMVGFGDPNLPNIRTLISDLGYTDAVVSAPVRRRNILTCNSTCNDYCFSTDWMFWWRTIATSRATDAALNCSLDNYTPDHTLRTSVYLGWTDANAAESNDWVDVCWAPELRLWVGIAKNGSHRIMWSADGRTWTAVTAPGGSPHAWVGLAWSGEYFLAVAPDGFVMGSSDGKNWTMVVSPDPPPTPPLWNTICWAGGTIQAFVALSADGHVGTASSTGSGWDAAFATVESNTWTKVCYSADRDQLVAVSNDGTHRITYSADASTWNVVTAPEQNKWQSVTWSHAVQKYVAVATATGSSGTHFAMTSPDGAAWTQHSTPTNDWKTVACIQGTLQDPTGALPFWFDGLTIPIFAFGDSTSTTQGMMSTDGETWTAITDLPTTGKWVAAAWATNQNMLYPVCTVVGQTGYTETMQYTGNEV